MATTSYYAVRRRRGGPWDWSRDLRQQASWDEHARFMDGLVDEGFLLLGGPLEDDREVLHIVRADSKEAVLARLAEDVWEQTGHLQTYEVLRWTILLDGLQLHISCRESDIRGHRAGSEW